jgi:hypothetical protein
MSTPPPAPQRNRLPRGVFFGLWIGWIVIAIKCALAPWAMARWHVPIDPGWVIIPTLILAGLVTVLAITHDWARNEATEESGQSGASRQPGG